MKPPVAIKTKEVALIAESAQGCDRGTKFYILQSMFREKNLEERV